MQIFKKFEFLNNSSKRRKSIVNKLNKTDSSLLIILVVSLFLFSFTSVDATTQNIGTFQKDSCVTLKQTCANCTYINVSTVTYPNSSIISLNKVMTNSNNVYYYTFCNTTLLGEYQYDTFGNPDGIKATGSVSFFITQTGEQFDMSQSIIIVALLGIMGLFLVLGFTFSQEKWKVRSLFFISALIVGVIILNSIRVVMGSSNSLSSMGSSGLYVGLILAMFMMAYIMIYATIEVFRYFKEKRKMRWAVGENAY